MYFDSKIFFIEILSKIVDLSLFDRIGEFVT